MTTYYAVKVGHVPGVYTTWTDAALNVNGYSGAIYKKFTDLAAAEAFTGMPASAAFKPEPEPEPEPEHEPKAKSMGAFGKTIKPVIRIRKKDTENLSQLERRYYAHSDYTVNDVIHVYTDGSTYNNGKKNAYGGYGVFFATKKIPNITKRLATGKVTNNVGELRAIIDAMKVITKHFPQKFVIHYDSKYAESVTTGKKQAHTNLELVRESKELYREVRDCVKFEHIKAHSRRSDLHSVGNEIADALAKGLKNF